MGKKIKIKKKKKKENIKKKKTINIRKFFFFIYKSIVYIAFIEKRVVNEIEVQIIIPQ